MNWHPLQRRPGRRWVHLDLLIDLSRDGEDEALDVARHVAQAHMDLRTQRGGFRIRGKLTTTRMVVVVPVGLLLLRRY